MLGILVDPSVAKCNGDLQAKQGGSGKVANPARVGMQDAHVASAGWTFP